ncbi:transcriptional repressor [bacterium]|nr:MAG: transcriptional repressor [bacterium]
MDKSAAIFKRLREKGYRLTSARKAIVNIFLKRKEPLSVSELRIFLERNSIHVNKTTVYREIEFLLARKMIRELQIGDRIKRFEIWPDDHHHHLICTNCKKVECVEMESCLVNEEKNMAARKKFKIFNHSLKFFGLCENCQ